MFSDLWSFYRSNEWEGFRKGFLAERLARDGELICEECGKPIVNKYQAILHHKVELTELNVKDYKISLNEDNIELVCFRCHNKIHERFGFSGTRHIYVVWGSPCAGKRDWVRENAGRDDLIVDIDGLYECMGNNRKAIKGNVLDCYRLLEDMIRTRRGRWRNAWVIRTLPLEIDRELIVKKIGGGELIYIEADKDKCLAEARLRGGDWEKWVEDWWSLYKGC